MSWVDTQREDELVDLWPEHAEALIGAIEFRDRNHKAIVIYLDIEPVDKHVVMVTYMSWRGPFTGGPWLDEVWRRDNLIWTKRQYHAHAGFDYGRVSI